MTMPYIKDCKYTTWSNHIFSHGLCSDWPVRGQASTHPQLVYSSTPSPFVPPPATAPIILFLKIAIIFLTHPQTYSATASANIYHCIRFVIEPVEPVDINLSDLPIPDPGSWIQTQAHYHNATLTIHENRKWNEINMLALKLSLLLTTLSSQIFKICFSTIAKQAFV